jgi:hypothetical protein
MNLVHRPPAVAAAHEESAHNEFVVGSALLLYLGQLRFLLRRRWRLPWQLVVAAAVESIEVGQLGRREHVRTAAAAVADIAVDDVEDYAVGDHGVAHSFAAAWRPVGEATSFGRATASWW